MVLLKGLDEGGLVWYTNYQSRKGRELGCPSSGRAAVLLAELERVVRIEGRVEQISEAESDAYYQTRPLGSRIGAWASPQSEVIPSRAAVGIRAGPRFKLSKARIRCVQRIGAAYRLVPTYWSSGRGGLLVCTIASCT